ncbi:MAG: hypothetical protein O2794_01865 [bacterium]|nr:hypothetical protein [bacterium]
MFIKTKLTFLIVTFILGVYVGYTVGQRGISSYWQKPPKVTDFASCAKAGYSVAESYPRTCRDGSGETYTESIGNTIEKSDLIMIDMPHSNDVIKSPLTITGKARGLWFFEASFPVVLTDWDGKIIAQHYGTAQGEWMTESFVPYESVIAFESPYKDGDPDFMRRGTLILQRDNPSGLPENDDALEIPVRFE